MISDPPADIVTGVTFFLWKPQSPFKRMKVGDYRIIFEETATEIRVTKVGPRGGVYGDGDG
jgi:mRNA-degrading endonuclease RelE of RelBE toxin-antitoxin system